MSILQFIGGILLTLFGALTLLVGELIGATLGDTAAISFYVLGVFFAALGIVYLFIGYGLWEGRGWAWTVNVALAIIGLAGSVVEYIVGLGSGGSASVILTSALADVLVLSYLTRGHVKAFFGRGLPYTREFVTNYTEKVMRHLVLYPAESARVLTSFDKSGQSGVVDYLKGEDPDLTIEEARAVAFAITSDKDRLMPATRDGTREGSPSNSRPDETATGSGDSKETNSEQESKKEKSWIDKWLQR